jgi:protein required for attachment to host cells
VNRLAIPHDAVVFVGDGRKALFLRNAGDEKFPNLKTERVFAEENPPTHEQATDRPGSAFARAGTHRRSSMEETDWHHLQEHRFTERVVAALEDLVRRRDVPALVIAAPPRTLADLRRALHADVRKRIVAEVGKDLTKHPWRKLRLTSSDKEASRPCRLSFTAPALGSGQFGNRLPFKLTS